MHELMRWHAVRMARGNHGQGWTVPSHCINCLVLLIVVLDLFINESALARPPGYCRVVDGQARVLQNTNAA